MIKIQEPIRPWEIVHMNWETGLSTGGDRSYNACLVIFDSFSKTSIFLPYYKDDLARDTALLIWNRVVSWTGIFANIICDRDSKFMSSLWKNLHQSFGTKLYCSTAYHTQTDCLTKRIIQTLEDMKVSIPSSTNQAPALLEKGWNPRLPLNFLRKDLPAPSQHPQHAPAARSSPPAPPWPPHGTAPHPREDVPAPLHERSTASTQTAYPYSQAEFPLFPAQGKTQRQWKSASATQRRNTLRSPSCRTFVA
ncbi:hypothetical protein O181_013131 [Austropuccinia psidii MF-1]|uniref:Integrase catalytic domain-containing protein n=1 Tax=Austropuccinia psidii MF-1 TaxID=1389203 RepID=A0A9Q3BVU7_9BASI|nr:hypothetical protein [Austropuccinia psidii MF-1]